MKAAVLGEKGVEIRDLPKPEPKPNEVLIKVRAASVNPLDWHYMRGTPYIARMVMGPRKPKVTRLGIDVAGQVEAVGSKITEFTKADVERPRPSVQPAPSSLRLKSGKSTTKRNFQAPAGIRSKRRASCGRRAPSTRSTTTISTAWTR